MEEGHKPGSEERQKSVYFCRKVSAFVDSDVCKARTTKVTCVERVVFKLHKARLGMNLVSGSAERERDDAFWFAVIRYRALEETRHFCKCSSLIKLDKGPRDRQVDTPGEFSVP